MSQVIVVGAGPTGLLLAGDLAEAGVAVTLLERRNGEVSNMSRAFGVHARTMEQLDARGLAERLEQTGVARIRNVALFDRVHVDLGRMDSRFPYLLITPQYNVEQVLRDRAVAAGVNLVYDAKAIGLCQDSDGVVVNTVGPAGVVTTHRAAYLVGADGVNSRVRQALGVPYPGKAVLKSIMLADVRLTEEPADSLTVNGRGREFAFIAPFGDGWWRVFCWDRTREVHDDAPLDLDEVSAVTKRALGTDFGMHDPRWMSRFHSDERQVRRYRVGRVFLAGDAAHCHSPAGGLGMNTGLQDAANLGWKLAAVTHGAPDALLDTYQAERHPVGREVLRISGTLIRMAMLRSRPGRALRGRIGGAVTRIPAVQTRLMGRLSAIGFAYDRPRGSHPLVGTRAPDVELAGGTRLYEALRGGQFVLIAPGASADITGWHDRVTVAAPFDIAGGPSMLIRPDGYIAWATDNGHSDNGTATALRTALTGLAGRANGAETDDREGRTGQSRPSGDDVPSNRLQ